MGQMIQEPPSTRVVHRCTYPGCTREQRDGVWGDAKLLNFAQPVMRDTKCDGHGEGQPLQQGSEGLPKNVFELPQEVRHGTAG